MSDEGIGDGPGPSAGGDAPAGGRRELLGRLAIGAGTCAALAGTTPLAVALLAPAVTESPEREAPFLDVAAEGDVKSEAPLHVELRAMGRDGWMATEADLGSAWLIRTPLGIRAFSATCPHLGCSIEKDVRGFYCPCHASRFDGQGASTAANAPSSSCSAMR